MAADERAVTATGMNTENVANCWVTVVNSDQQKHHNTKRASESLRANVLVCY